MRARESSPVFEHRSRPVAQCAWGVIHKKLPFSFSHSHPGGENGS